MKAWEIDEPQFVEKRVETALAKLCKAVFFCSLKWNIGQLENRNRNVNTWLITTLANKWADLVIGF